MKQIRSLLLMLLTVCLSIGAYAQQNSLSIPGVTMSRGGEAMLSVNMDNVDEVTAVEFTLEIPAGFTINPISAVLTERAKNHQMTARKLKNGKYKFMVMSNSNAPIDGIAGMLFTMQINASESLTDETDYSMIITDAVMTLKSGENILQKSEAGKITIKSMPNLHVVSLECSEPIAGTAMTVRWKVRNDGRGATGNTQWKDYIWLVPNITFGTVKVYQDPTLLATIDNVTALKPSESYENQTTVDLPERIYGTYDLLVTSDMFHVTDVDFSPTNGIPPYPYKPEESTYGFLKATNTAKNHQVEEEGESNGKSDNFFYKQISIAVPPLPDLQVTNIKVDVIPLGYVTGQVLPEDFVEAMCPTPLTAAGVAHNTVPYSGKKIRVTATIANKGGATITGKNWKNALFMSTSEDRSSSNLTGLSSASSNNVTIQPGETTTVSFVARLPYEIYGDIFFHVYADTDDEVYELANTQNNWGCSPAFNVLLTPGADFLPQNLRVPSVISSGSSFSISYDVKNIGSGVPYSTPWRDKVYISKANTLNNEAKEIGSYIQGGSWIGKTMYSAPVPTGGIMIHPAEDFHYTGDNYSANRSLNVNNLAAGKYYIFVKVDAEDKVFEFKGEDNNVISFGPIQVVTPDLTCELLTISEETLTTGQTVAFSWKLKNTGAGDIKNATIKDAIYAGSNANGSDLIKIGEVSNQVSIVSGGEKTLRVNIKIPDNKSLAGKKYIFVKTDIENKVDESDNSNNLSKGIEREFKYVSPDDPNPGADNHVKGMNIAVVDLTAPGTVSPGQQIQISYQVKNNGDLKVNKDVTHEVYISDKKSFDASSATKCTTSGTPTSVNGLEPGKSLTAYLGVTIPSNIKGGAKYLYVVLNGNNQLSEKTKDDNVTSSPVYMDGNLPDLSISDIIVPSVIMTAEPTIVSWTLKNGGSWSAAETTCLVYLSDDRMIDTNDKLLTSVKTKALSVGGSETMTASIILDDDIMGDYNLIIKANDKNDIEESDTDNNVASTSFVSKQSPLPDLVISDLSVDGEFLPGATITVNAKVKNVGDSYTRKDKWSDVFYLSTDFTLKTDNAILVGSKAHVGKLEKDDIYPLTATLKIPTDVHGYYYLYAKTDGSGTIFENNRENNTTRMLVQVKNGSEAPADLAVKSISAPSSITAGSPVTISYTLANSGVYTAKGNLREVIYLSKDEQWDQNDQMVGVVSGTIDLAPGNEVVRKVTGRITNIVEGSYYLIVRTNSTHAIAETDYDNNTTVAKSTTGIRFADLSMGSTVSVNTSGYYKLPVNTAFAGKTIGLNLSHGSTVPAGLYVAYESVPSTAHYERSSSVIQTTEQEVLIPGVKEGNYYVLAQDNSSASLNQNEFVLDGDGAVSGAKMSLSAQEVRFGVSSLSIKEGGNNGWITTETHGALLDTIMDFRLLRNGQEIPIESMTFYDQTSSKIRFNLNDAKTGTYDIVSELPDGSLATMKDGFRVVPGVNVGLGVKIGAPHWTRLDNFVPITITYANGGNTDIVIYELLLTTDGGDFSMTVDGFKNPQSEIHIRPEGLTDSRGYVVIPPGVQRTINCYFRQHQTGSTSIDLYIVK